MHDDEILMDVDDHFDENVDNIVASSFDFDFDKLNCNDNLEIEHENFFLNYDDVGIEYEIILSRYHDQDLISLGNLTINENFEVDKDYEKVIVDLKFVDEIFLLDDNAIFLKAIWTMMVLLISIQIPFLLLKIMSVSLTLSLEKILLFTKNYLFCKN